MKKQFRAAVISQDSKSSLWTIEAMKKYFETVDDLHVHHIEVTLGETEPQVMYKGKPLEQYDCIYCKGSFRYANLLRAVTQSLQGKAYMPLLSKAFTVGHDKLLTQLKLQEANVPTPKTYLASTVDAAKMILGKINFPIIMKFPHGTHGKGVMFADSIESASSMLDALAALRQPALIQEYVETGGIDTRAFIVGDKVVAAMKRKAVEGEKRANIHAGGTGESAQLDAYTKKMAIETGRALGCDICAVDILQSVRGPKVIEINLSPGLQGITKCTKVNVAEHIAKFLFAKTKEFKEGKKEKTTKILGELGIAETDEQEIITNLDFRGDRILLPEVVTKITKFNEKKEVCIKAKKEYLKIEEFTVGKEEKK